MTNEVPELKIPSTTNPDTGLSEKDEHFLSILFSEAAGDFQYALKLSGINESPFAIRKRLKTEIQEATKQYLSSEAPKAAMRVVSVLHDPNSPGTKNMLTAAKEILDRSNIKEQEDAKVTENYVFILPAKDEAE